MADSAVQDEAEEPWCPEPDPLAVFSPAGPDAQPKRGCLKGTAGHPAGRQVTFDPSVGKTRGELEEERANRPKGIVYRSIAAYHNPDDPEDLEFKAHQLVLVIDEGDGPNDWWEGVLGGKTGSFPGTYMKKMAYQPEDQSGFWEQPAPEAPPAKDTTLASATKPSGGVFKFSMGDEDPPAAAAAAPEPPTIKTQQMEPEPSTAPTKRVFALGGFGGSESTDADEVEDDPEESTAPPNSGESPAGTPRRYSGRFGFSNEYSGKPDGSPALADLREEEYDSPSEDEEAALELEALTPSNTVAHPIPRGSSPVFGRSASITSSTTSRSSTLPHAPPEPAEKQQRFFCSALDVKPTTSSLGTTELPRIYREGWLRKKGGGKANPGRMSGSVLARRNWKTRWFVLDGTKLKYFKSTGHLDRPLGTIEIASDSIVNIDEAREGHAFVLSTFVRTYSLIAPTEDDLNAWVDSLAEAKERAALDL